MEYAIATRSKVEKHLDCPRKVSDAPDEKETQESEE